METDEDKRDEENRLKWFERANQRLSVVPKDTLFAYALRHEDNPPIEIRLYKSMTLYGPEVGLWDALEVTFNRNPMFRNKPFSVGRALLAHRYSTGGNGGVI